MTETEVENYREKIIASQRAGDPKSEIIDGEMWSDQIGLPDGVSKEEADASEIEVALARLEDSSGYRVASNQRCLTLWLAPQVCDPILARFEQLGGITSWLAFPTEPVKVSPDGVGLHQRFAGGYIYWSPETGAHAISFVTAKVWERNGWELGWLGYPTGGEVAVAGSDPVAGELNGWVQQFEGGRIYRSPILEGFQVAAITGKILERWLEIGGPSSPLGFPIADEAVTPDGVGRVSVFQGGSIYWHPDSGAWEVYDFLGSVWEMRQATESEWGYPAGPPIFEDVYVGDDFPVVISQDFSNGQLDLFDEMGKSGLVAVENKEVSQLLLEFLEYSGFSFGLLGDLRADESSVRSLDYVGSLCKNKDSSRAEFGGVTIPSNYDYWACRKKESTPNPDKFTLHDYCSYSMDEFAPGGKNAEFSGACARHDMCYETSDVIVIIGYKKCNSDFKSNMMLVCRENYDAGSNVLRACNGTARAYYFAVTVFHPIRSGY